MSDKWEARSQKSGVRSQNGSPSVSSCDREVAAGEQRPLGSRSRHGNKGLDGSGSVSVGVVAAVAFALLVLAGILFLSLRRPASQSPAGPSREAEAYASQLSVAGLHLSAEENFLGQQVVYLEGKLTNKGDKTIRLLKVRLFFYDTLNQVILREDQEVLGTRSAPLPPGQTREFRLLFDRLPDSWNRQTPQLQLVSLQLQ